MLNKVRPNVPVNPARGSQGARHPMTATGLYGSDVSIQSQLSSGTVVDFCASAGNNSCSGGSSNGISPSDPAATGLFSLIVNPAVASLTLDAAFVRYQGITGNGFNGASGIGTNSTVVINPTGTPTVPIPGAVWLFGSGLIGLVALNRRRKNAMSSGVAA